MDAQTLIRELGGATKVARDLGIPFTTVANWHQRNNIPAWRMDAVGKLAKRAGIGA